MQAIAISVRAGHATLALQRIGLLALELYDPVRETLEAFFWHQTEEGQLPVKLHSIHVVTRFLYSFFSREQPMETMLKPKYVSGHGAPSLDGQGMLIIAALTYIQKTEDITFLQTHWQQLQLAIKWLESYCKDPEAVLLHQGAYADWADSIARRGRILYTNVIYWKALSEMSSAAATQDLKEEAAYYYAEAENVSTRHQCTTMASRFGLFCY